MDVCYTLSMEPWQKRIIAVLAAANAVLLVTLLISVTRFTGSASQARLPTPVPTLSADADFSPYCQRRAVQMLSENDLGGTATVVNGTLRFDLVYRVRQDPGGTDAGQQVWTAFDVALDMADGQCNAFSRTETMITTQGAQPPIRVYAAADMTDLKAYRGGELSEPSLIDRVEYRIEPVDDDEL